MKKKIMSLSIIIILYLFVAVALAQDTTKNIYYSKDILELIHSEEDISFEDAVIIGDLKLNKSQKIVNSSITIKNSEVIDDIDFGNVFLKKPISFQGTIFSGSHLNFMNLRSASDISFSGARFNCIAKFKDINTSGSMTFDKTSWSDTAFFENCTCKGYASFRNSEFQKEFTLKNTNITGGIYFEDSQFNSDALFRNSTFENESDFLGVHFSRRCDLRGTKFYEPAVFTRSDFDEIADFSSSNFVGGGEFSQASFANVAVFSQARFYNRTGFNKSIFDGFADFSSARFMESAFFIETQFNKAARFTNSTFLENVSFSSAFFDRDAYFDASRFESKIDITNAAFSELALPWNAIKGRVIYDKATQLSLINNYKKLGWTSDYKDSYYNYREEKKRSEPLGLEKFFDYLSLVFWGYGTKMYYSLAWITIFALFFAVIYYGLARIKWAEAVEISSQPGLERCPYAKTEHDLRGKLPFKKALLFSIKTLLLMENQDDIEIRYAHIGKIIWIEKVFCGYLAVNFMNYLLELLQSYFKLP